MPDTFVKIASVTVVSGGAGNIEFTAIPNTYTDLCLKLSLRNSSTNASTYLTFNGSSSGYSERMLYNASGSANSASRSGTYILWIYSMQSNYTSNTFNSCDVYIPNYAGSNSKSISIDNTQENNAADIVQNLDAGLWSNSAAITSINISSANDFVQYSTATLYGISNS